ncbi:MAG TPA: hypothetical protein VMQ86_13840 [Bryobacteraceae bacterium]|jgi:hypothetical protein|nr:hypothetical protein [Bryobacteraceae bacterium]
MKLGANRKKIEMYALGILVLGGAYLFYDNVLSGPSSPEPSRPSRATTQTSSAPQLGPSYSGTSPVTRRAATASRSGEEFRPSLKPKRPEDRVDPMTIDPTLRLDLLAKVQAVDLEGGRRNLFAVGAPPPPPLPPEPKIKLKPGSQAASAEAPPGPPPTPAAPQAPPITLKYYGYTSARGDNRKHAFFLDGDDILVAAEGETVKKRYRVVRIGVNSVVMEDTQFKHEQTLPLAEEAAG